MPAIWSGSGAGFARLTRGQCTWTALRRCGMFARGVLSDLDRLRREQEVLYAVFKKMMRLIPSQLGQMKEELGNNVQTNMGIDRVLGLVPIGLRVFKDPSSVQKFAVGEEQADEMISWNGQWILLPKEGAIPKLLKEAGFK